jgi:hypothetical protein
VNTDCGGGVDVVAALHKRKADEANLDDGASIGTVNGSDSFVVAMQPAAQSEPTAHRNLSHSEKAKE